MNRRWSGGERQRCQPRGTLDAIELPNIAGDVSAVIWMFTVAIAAFEVGADPQANNILLSARRFFMINPNEGLPR